MRAYAYLVLTSQIEERSSVVGNSVPEVDAQKVFKSTFMELINEGYYIGIETERYQGVSEHALSKVYFFSRHKHTHASKQFKLKH